MHIVVCVKQVPDSAQIRVHPVTNRIMRQGVPAIINPFDLVALEEALRIKDRTGARVTVISMGPPAAEAALEKCVSFGADEAILLTDMAFAGADTLATTFVLMSAVRQIAKSHPVDIVFTGKQTIDGDTAQVGPGIAVRLGWQLLTYVSKIRSIDTETRRIVIERRA
jgi:electron transfer flavoprotein beta subunit